MIRNLSFSIAVLLCVGCTNQAPRPATSDHAILVTDSRNDAVHQISMDGTYEGDFLGDARERLTGRDHRAWASPRGMLVLDAGSGSGRIWLTAERGLSAWSAGGKFERLLYSDSVHLEDPTGIVRVDDEILVMSEDKKRMLVFDRNGSLEREFGYPEFYRAKDVKLGADGMLYVGSDMRGSKIGLVSVWDPHGVGMDAKPAAYRLLPDANVEDGTISVHGLVFDEDGKLLITDFNRGKLERWDLDRNAREEILLKGPWGTYRDLERGPDGLVYMSGRAGLYRFDSRAKAADLESLEPFFDATVLADRYQHEFTPTSITFVPRALARPVTSAD